jgi:hypothetical protein
LGFGIGVKNIASLAVIRPQNWTIWDGDVLRIMKHSIRPRVNLADLALSANEFGLHKGHIVKWKKFVAVVASL